MLLHPVTVTALLCPLLAYLLCRHLGSLDAVTLFMFEAASLSLSGLLMWLRSRYLASLYLTERQNRKHDYVAHVRSEVDAERKGNNGAFSAVEKAAPSPRTVARLAPVLPAFLGCCFFLLSIHCLIVAALHAIWYVRSEVLST